MVWYGTVGLLLYGMVQYGTVWYGTVQYGTVWYGTVGLVWYSMVSKMFSFLVRFANVFWDEDFYFVLFTLLLAPPGWVDTGRSS